MEMENMMPAKTVTPSNGQSSRYVDPPGIKRTVKLPLQLWYLIPHPVYLWFPQGSGELAGPGTRVTHICVGEETEVQVA